MSFKRGDLLLVPFPFSDLTATKRRPVLALTGPDAFGDFVGLPVTSRPQGSTGLPLTATDVSGGVLPKASWVRTDHPVTLHASLVLRTVARVRAPLTDDAVRRLCDGLQRTP